MVGLSFRKFSPKLILGFGAALLLAWALPATPWKLIGFGRRLPTTDRQLESALHHRRHEFLHRLFEVGRPDHYFHVTGKVEASTEPQDMSLQRMLGHLPAILHTNPRSILVVGCGAGVTAGSFVVHPEVEHITICEIEPRIPPATAKYFADANHNVMKDPRTRIVFDDARHFVLTANEKFDIITSDPIHPWVKGHGVALYHRVFRSLQAPSESGRHRHAVGTAV
jgi:spermidine synthase